MISKELLESFCTDERSSLRVPMNQHGYTFATDGHVLIAVPELEEYKDNECVPDFKQFLHNKECHGPWLPVVDPYPSLETIPCTFCNGTGQLDECPECDGSGEVGFDNDYNEYEFECKTCDGDGKVTGKCERCDGLGKVYDQKTGMDIGRQRFQPKLLHKISTLPGIEICVDFAKETYIAAPIRFEGGWGLIMPMMKEEDSPWGK